MTEERYVAATELPERRERDWRTFRISEELFAQARLDWSPTVQLKIEENDDGTFELVARSVS